jgi:uncharacterized membrane protein SpoIIM required for sporulation
MTAWALTKAGFFLAAGGVALAISVILTMVVLGIIAGLITAAMGGEDETNEN